MEHPAGESNDGSLRVDFDRRLKLEFHGSRLTSDGIAPPWWTVEGLAGYVVVMAACMSAS